MTKTIFSSIYKYGYEMMGTKRSNWVRNYQNENNIRYEMAKMVGNDMGSNDWND